ncbi:apoptosis-associated speck-like protein containing a CARD isoform X1 [Mustelus asterias]
MPRTVRQCIVDALEELGEDDFRSFKANLRELKTMQGFRNIPWGKLEKADKLNTAKLMVDYYREGNAGEIAKQILRDGSQQDTADALAKELQMASQTSARCPDLTQASQTSARCPDLTQASQTSARCPDLTQEKNPVDKYFTRIVQGFNSVDSVLDELLAAGVLTGEHYGTIRAKATKQERMRELLTIIRGQGSEAKTKLWEAMVEADPYFTKNLTSE